MLGGTKTLAEIAKSHVGLSFRKWEHYFPIYDDVLGPLRGTGSSLLEIGIGRGGSLQLWREFMGEGSRVVGADILAGVDGFECHLVDQGSRDSLRRLRKVVGEVDVVIDDGGHMMDQQVFSLEELWGMARKFYIVEDTHTSYWVAYGGGYGKAGTFIEFCKRMVDDLHGFHGRGGDPRVTEWTETVRSIRFFDSMVVIEKK